MLQRRLPARAAAVLLCALVPAGAGARGAAASAPHAGPQAEPARTGSADVLALRQAISEAEDRRAPSEADVKTLVDGTHHPGEAVQRMAVRALGRLERPAMVPDIEPLLASPFASVRAQAADALGQAVQAAGREQVDRIAAAIGRGLEVEPDPAVRGVLCQTIGRLPYGAAEGARRAEVALLAALAVKNGGTGLAPLAIRAGVAKGFEALLRRHAKLFSPSAETVQLLRALAVGRLEPQRPAEVETAVRVRRLALSALASARQADEDTVISAAGDPDGQVRRLALTALAASQAGLIPEAVRRRLMAGGLADRDDIVRYEALRIHGRSLAGDAPDWSPVLAAISDRSPHVALLAIDLLGSTKARPGQAVERLRLEADTLPSPEWHRPARALVALARVAPDEAKVRVPRFAASGLWPVRMYAARAAALVGDADTLRRLAVDPHDNVREAAIGGLRTVAGHDADDVYLGALERPDYQLILTAARALEGTPQRERATAALLASLARITAERRETSRDPRLAVVSRVAELGQALDAAALDSYTRDFDPQVAAAAAAVVGKWTGRTPAIDPRPLAVTVPRLADVERLLGARAVVRVAGRGTFEIELLPDESPATVARFVALVNAGYYNGLTFHRVEPNFVVQGGSPRANEFVGDGPFMRDEIGLEPHVRGSASISTRGRDTGDAQIWFNLVDNPRLDHGYTVFGRVVAGAEVLDRILECDVIERIALITRRGRD